MSMSKLHFRPNSLFQVWAVNVSNKKRDIEFEAQMLLNSPEAVPATFQQPKVLSMAKKFARILRKKQRKAPSFKLLSPKEVVLEVVPRVLQGFWVLPPLPLLNMPSQRLSKMSVGVTKAVLDQVSNALTTVEHQVIFSRSIRDEMVQSIMNKIRQTFSHDVLVNKIKRFAPVLLSEIVEVAVGQISGMFQPQSPKATAHLTPTVEPAATTPIQEDLNLAVTEGLLTTSPEINSVVVSTPPPFPTPPAEPPSITDVEARENENDEPTRDPHPAVVPPTKAHPAPFVTDVEARVAETEEPCLEKDPKLSREPASVVSPALPAPLTHPAEPVIITTVKGGSTTSPAETKQPTSSPVTSSAEVSPPPAPQTSPTEPHITDVQDRGGINERPNLEEGQKPTREPASAPSVSSAPLATPPELVVIVSANPEVRERREQGFFCRPF
ncbi:proteoglycan 4-like [Epinephelus moara]|uniref:proteoglycan 4-like n=1 Tax=Epinephelus moara TaxID=300413 RepID=UPI00214E50AD|nr:proteoglycan 4-like [Epinephelus moara]